MGMIKNHFLSLKYVGVKKIHEITRSQKSMTNIGWKCRKYIRWSAVHEKDTDRESLKVFADNLIDNGTLEIKLYGDISRVLFNVQKWRFDKDSFSIEPAFTYEWQELFVISKNAGEQSNFVFSYLNEKGVNINRIDSSDVQEIFYYRALMDFYSKSMRTDSFLNESLYTNSITHDNVYSTFSAIYNMFGLSLERQSNIRELLIALYNDLEISIVFREKIEKRIINQVKPASAVISYREMNLSELFRIKNVCNSIYIEINSNNLFIKKIRLKNNLIIHFEIFIKSLAITYLDLNNLQDNLDLFFQYLSLKLNDEVRNFTNDLPK